MTYAIHPRVEYSESYIQKFNIPNKQTFKNTQKKLEKYRDLVVRIACYCKYFVALENSQQN